MRQKTAGSCGFLWRTERGKTDDFGYSQKSRSDRERGRPIIQRRIREEENQGNRCAVHDLNGDRQAAHGLDKTRRKAGYSVIILTTDHDPDR